MSLFSSGRRASDRSVKKELDSIPSVSHNTQRVSRRKVTDYKDFPIVLESAEVVKVVGISPIQLNKFVERRSYGIAPSYRAGKGRGSRRRFREHDVYGVALVWWLFEAGLRKQTIQYVLNKICGHTKSAKASDAAKILSDKETEMLAVKREPRRAGDKREYPKQEVFLVDWSEANHLVESTVTASVLFIPIADRFEKLRDEMRRLSPLTEMHGRSE
jgi:hypothetical protein